MYPSHSRSHLISCCLDENVNQTLLLDNSSYIGKVKSTLINVPEIPQLFDAVGTISFIPSKMGTEEVPNQNPVTRLTVISIRKKRTTNGSRKAYWSPIFCNITKKPSFFRTPPKMSSPEYLNVSRFIQFFKNLSSSVLFHRGKSGKTTSRALETNLLYFALIFRAEL